MSKMKLNTDNLSKDEGNSLKSLFGLAIDIIVKLTGGKSSFGGKK
jgi:hypothetical protein